MWCAQASRVRTIIGLLLVVCAPPDVTARAAMAQGAADPSDLIRQARRFNSEGNQDAALALYRQVLARSPDLFDAHLGAGIALDLLARYKEARQHFATAIELSPDATKNLALTAMAISYAFGANAKQSAAFYRQVFDRQMAAQDAAAAAETANALGRVYLESGDTDKAFTWYQTGHETSRRQSNVPGEQLDLWDLRWAHAQARIAARRGNSREARRQVDVVKALLDKGTNPEQQIQYPYLVGYVDLFLKDYQGAIAELQHADQTDPFVLSLLARAYERADDWNHAAERYRQVLASNAHSLNNAFARPLALRMLKSK